MAPSASRPRCRPPPDRSGRTAPARRPASAPGRPARGRDRSALREPHMFCTILRMRSASVSRSCSSGRAGWLAGRSASNSCTIPSAPVSGLLISWATPAPSSPSADSDRERNSRSCAWRSSAVLSLDPLFQRLVPGDDLVGLLGDPPARRLEARRHLVERVAERAQLVVRRRADARVQVSARDLPRAGRQHLHPVASRCANSRAAKDPTTAAIPIHSSVAQRDPVHRQERGVDRLVDQRAQPQPRHRRVRADQAPPVANVLGHEGPVGGSPSRVPGSLMVARVPTPPRDAAAMRRARPSVSATSVSPAASRAT